MRDEIEGELRLPKEVCVCVHVCVCVCVHVKLGFASNFGTILNFKPGWAVYCGVPILTCSNNNFVLARVQ